MDFSHYIPLLCSGWVSFRLGISSGSQQNSNANGMNGISSCHRFYVSPMILRLKLRINICTPSVKCHELLTEKRLSFEARKRAVYTILAEEGGCENPGSNDHMEMAISEAITSQEKPSMVTSSPFFPICAHINPPVANHLAIIK